MGFFIMAIILIFLECVDPFPMSSTCSLSSSSWSSLAAVIGIFASLYFNYYPSFGYWWIVDLLILCLVSYQAYRCDCNSAFRLEIENAFFWV